MKIAPKAVAGFMAKPTGSAVLFYGPDSGLVRERAQQLTKTILGGQADALSILDTTEAKLASDPALLADELSSVSLMASQRVILIRDAGDKLTKILEGAVELLRPDVYVIVMADELTPRSSLRGWFEKAAHVSAVACYHDEARDIGELVRDTFSKAGLQAPSEVIHYLAGKFGNDRYITRQELEKILVYMGEEKHVTMEIARELINDSREMEIDEAINALADKNLAALDKALTALVRDGVAPMQYLRGLSRYFMRLYAIKLQAQESSVESVIAGLRPPVFFKQVPALTRHVKSWNFESISKALALINAAELACKTSDVPPFATSERELFKATRA